MSLRSIRLLGYRYEEMPAQEDYRNVSLYGPDVQHSLFQEAPQETAQAVIS
jgi:hypothetical protein